MGNWPKIAVLIGAGAVAGVIGASAYSANAADTTPAATSSSSSAASTAAPRGDHDGDGPRRGAGGHAGETAITGTKASTLKAAALGKVPGGTVERVETDSGDAAYEVHMTTKAGKEVTVKFDKNLTFVAVEDGAGT